MERGGSGVRINLDLEGPTAPHYSRILCLPFFLLLPPSSLLPSSPHSCIWQIFIQHSLCDRHWVSQSTLWILPSWCLSSWSFQFLSNLLSIHFPQPVKLMWKLIWNQQIPPSLDRGHLPRGGQMRGTSRKGLHRREFTDKNYKTCGEGFPGGAVVENLPANAGDTGSSPGLGRSHMPWSNWAREPQLLSLRVWSLCPATREAAIVRGPRTAMKSGPCLPQLEKALVQKRRPNTAKK